MSDPKAALEGKLRAMVRKLVVSVDDDSVTIEGMCRLYYHKQLSQHEAMRMFPHKRLVNNIEVHAPAYPVLNAP